MTSNVRLVGRMVVGRLLKKKGREVTLPSSYRCICLPKLRLFTQNMYKKKLLLFLAGLVWLYVGLNGRD